jgi:glutamate synthase (NADPH) large chain
VLSSYRGGMNFEAIGLSRALVAEFFPGTPSRISGIGLSGIARRVLALHDKAWDEGAIALPVGGSTSCAGAARCTPSTAADPHAAEGGRDRQLPDLQALHGSGAQLPPVALRDLLDFRMEGRTPVTLEEVESITEIRKRLVAPGISLGR